MALTYYEANLVLLMDLALQSARLHREAPNFTAREMAKAIEACAALGNARMNTTWQASSIRWGFLQMVAANARPGSCPRSCLGGRRKQYQS